MPNLLVITHWSLTRAAACSGSSEGVRVMWDWLAFFWTQKVSGGCKKLRFVVTNAYEYRPLHIQPDRLYVELGSWAQL